MAEIPKSLAEIEDIAATLSVAAPEKLQSLLDFARYLASQPPANDVVSAPLDIPRPEAESVIAAVKRLSKTYPMLEKTQVFDQTSAIMSAHVLEEVSSAASIDQLEAVFAKVYQAYLSRK